jgi:hypothetical protein
MSGRWATSLLEASPTTQPDTTTTMNPSLPVVYRQLAIPVTTFDRIKDYQRAYMVRNGQPMTLVQAITAIVREHQLNEESEAHDHSRKQPAILRSV